MIRQVSECRLLGATLYPLTGLEQVEHRFRVLKVRESIPRDNAQPIRLQKWADRIWRQYLKCPTHPTQRFGFPAFLIPEGSSPDVETTIEIQDVPDKIYHIDVTEQVVTIHLNEASRTEIELICRILERPFSDKFRLLNDKFWRVTWTLYHKLLAENIDISQDIVNAYRGLKFGVVFLKKKGLYFATDLRTRYVSRKALFEYTKDEKESILEDYLNETDFDHRSFFLRDNGSVKIPCRFAGSTGQTISDFSFEAADKQQTIYEYYRKQYPDIVVEPNEEAIYVRDRSSQHTIAVPISRLFPIFTNEYEGFKKCSIRPYMSPTERVNAIEPFLNCLSNLKYGNSVISLSRDYFTDVRTIFIPPRLEYRNKKFLEPFDKGLIPDRSHWQFNKAITKWASQKLPILYEAYSYSDVPLPNMVLLYPKNIQRSERESFIEKLQSEVKRLTGETLQFGKPEFYSIGASERRGDSLLELADTIRQEHPTPLAVTVLWNRFTRNVYPEFKNTLNFSQCLTEKTFRNILDDFDSQKSTSKLCKLALGVLMAAGIKPWVLADDLHHDLHVGIDVLDGKVVYHFLYGKGGQQIRREFGKSSSRTGNNEAIKRFEIKKVLQKAIRSIVQEGYQLDNMVIHRDGRSWSSEQQGYIEAVQALQEDGILLSSFQYAAVEIRKNHLPIRLFSDVNKDGRKIFENPLPGTILVLDDTRVILTTTGKPSWDKQGRTAGNILLEIVDSSTEFNIEHIAEDAFWLTHLNWNAPDIEIGLPVTIQWSDQALRETYYSSIGELEEEELEDNSPDE
ncbi:hypothetical protein [uncultured Nostoc sp.]|uniref:hypothetical protein n=1 Tax=uncultured Nostoc sp. TaxID=340711 RepID=UPI0035CAC47F